MPRYNTWIVLAAIAVGLAGCSSKPAAQVSKEDMATVRQAQASNRIGDPKQKVLDSFKSGNKVMLGASSLEGTSIEEWKVEAFHDEDKRKDLFVTFLYFLDGKFVDSSDSRIDFRTNEALVERWKSMPEH